MKSFKLIKYWIIIANLAFFSFFSCSTNINGTIESDGSASLTVNSSIGPRIGNLINKIMIAAGEADTTSDNLILDAALLEKSLSNAPGNLSVQLKNSGNLAVNGTIRIPKINDFLNSNLSGTSGSDFIKFDNGKTGGTLIININQNKGSEIIKLLSPEIDDYLNALMAPIVTLENMTKTEYLELISLFYGKPVSEEIASAIFRISISFPGEITSCTGGNYSGKKADFNIPVLDLLVLEKPVLLEVTWKD